MDCREIGTKLNVLLMKNLTGMQHPFLTNSIASKYHMLVVFMRKMCSMAMQKKMFTCF